MRKTGGFGIVLLVVFVVIVAALPKLLLLVGITAVIMAAILIPSHFAKKKRDQASLELALNSQAAALDALASAGYQDTTDFVMEKGEKFLARITLQLAEYQSTGSTYSGGNAGVSVPLVGRVRGYVGGSRGSITKNPPALTPIDIGATTFTNQRVIFTGSQQTRIWELNKILSTEGGPNGIFVSISVSNAKTTSVLSEYDRNSIAPGVLLDVAQEAAITGEAAALEKAKTYAGLMREALAAQHTAK